MHRLAQVLAVEGLPQNSQPDKIYARTRLSRPFLLDITDMVPKLQSALAIDAAAFVLALRLLAFLCWGLSREGGMSIAATVRSNVSSVFHFVIIGVCCWFCRDISSRKAPCKALPLLLDCGLSRHSTMQR
jgi:hypothetical protein